MTRIRIGSFSILALLIVTSGWLFRNSLPYFSLGDTVPFLIEKGTLAFEPWWKTFFVAHVAGGIASLLVGPLLIWNLLLLRSRLAHIWIGRAYVTFVLAWGAPAGLVLSMTAKGGFAGQSGFFLLGVLWWGTTFLGLRAVRARRLVTHVGWMVRSYSIATSALSFRLFHLAFYLGGVSDRTNYVTSIWLSLVTSIVLGEFFAARSSRILVHSGPRISRSGSNNDPALFGKGVVS